MSADASPSVKPTRAWQRMLSGRRLDLLNPDPADVAILDIAHGLARVARWNGQTIGHHAFSVAQHALLVEDIAAATAPAEMRWDDRCRLAALLHDAAEYVIGDLISPFKTAIGLDYKAFETRLMAAIHAHFGLPPQLAPAITVHIKAADHIAAFFEATRLAGFSHAEASTYFGEPRDLPANLQRQLERLEAWPADVAQGSFIARYESLCTVLDTVVASPGMVEAPKA